jgi:predicted metal-binding membrane protein
MPKAIKLPQAAIYPFAWVITFLCAGLAWMFTYKQLAGMLSWQMYGTMGMPLGPFLFFWTIMMAAMMLPALAPIVSIRYERHRQEFSRYTVVAWLVAPLRLGVFIAGYLFIWCCFGLPIFMLGLLSNQLVLRAPLLSVGLGIILFIAAGIYQLGPLKRRCLTHCKPNHYTCVADQDAPVRTPFADLKAGVVHSISCLGSCGNLMIVLIAVGLMNLFWMVLLTLIVFIEKVWPYGYRLNALLGVALITYGMFSFIEPALLSGLYIQ